MKVRINTFKAPAGLTGDPVSVLAGRIDKVITRCSGPQDPGIVELTIEGGTADDLSGLKTKGYPVTIIE